MPVESGPYCQYCADDSGQLHGFEETVARMSQFWRQQEPGLSAADAEAKTLAYMADMPAWKDHPDLKGRLG
jgi:hypothetical protein